MRADIEAALALVTSTAAAHSDALRDLATVAGIVGGPTPKNVVADAQFVVSGALCIIAEAERPKGMTVRIEFIRTGTVVDGTRAEELARTTPKRANMASGRVYDLATGVEVNAGGHYSLKRRIVAEDLPALRAMKPGPTAVSKALCAIERDRVAARG